MMENGPEDQVTPAKGSIMLLNISLAIFGNFFIILTYCRNFKMRTVTNTLVVSLCFSDLLSAVADMPFWVSNIVNKQSLYRNIVVCRIMLSFKDFFLVAALLNMCGIALDRFITLVRGLRRKMTRTRARVIVIWSWLQALFSALPWCLASNTCEAGRCLGAHIYEPHVAPKFVNIIFKLVSLVLPMFSIYFVFLRILHSVRSSRKVNIENSYISRNSSAEKFAVDAYKRSSKTAIILFTMFMFCTSPYLGVVFYSVVTGKALTNFKAGFVISFIFSLKRSLFPAIYIFRNRMILSYLQETLRCGLCGASLKANARDSFVYTAGNSSSCFVLFSHSSRRSHVHPSVYDGDQQHFPKNLDVYFTGNKEQDSVIEERFIDIVKMERKETEPRIVLPPSQSIKPF